MTLTIKLSILVVQCIVVLGTPPNYQDICPVAPECIWLDELDYSEQNMICWNYQAECINDRCYCKKDGYNTCNCRPEVGGCRIDEANYDGPAKAFVGERRLKTNSCTNQEDKLPLQVHVISMHRGIEYGNELRDTVVDVHAINTDNNQKDVILVLASYRAIRWVLNLHTNINIYNLIIIESGLYNQPAPHIRLGESTIQHAEIIQTDYVGWGVGDDSSGIGSTPELLWYLRDRFGGVTTFSGAMRASRWNITLDLSIPFTSTTEVPTSESPDITTLDTPLTTVTENSTYFCPTLTCDRNCSFGYQRDEFGCEQCECNQEVTCPPIWCGVYCAYGYKKGEDGCQRCLCATPEVTCPPVKCRIHCEHGYQKGEDGCDRCICVTPDVTCKPVKCRIHCEYGYQKGEDGCARCICVTPDIDNNSTSTETNDTTDQYSSVLACPSYICSKTCQLGFQVDEFGCEICKCVSPPEATCPPLKCRIYCEYGYQKGEDGCDRCICVTPSLVTCPPVKCRIHCEYGYQTGEDGCAICICESAPCLPLIFCPIGSCKNGFERDHRGCEICACAALATTEELISRISTTHEQTTEVGPYSTMLKTTTISKSQTQSEEDDVTTTESYMDDQQPKQYSYVPLIPTEETLPAP